jgi:putative N6-adenine-specific DNA methylase
MWWTKNKMKKIYAITHQGLEPVVQKDINELLKVESVCGDSYAVFDVKDLIDACKFTYLSQSPIRVLYGIKEFNFNTDEDIDNQTQDLDVSELLSSEQTFKVTCKRIGNHTFNHCDIEKLVGQNIDEKVDSKVNLENPNIIIHVYIKENKCIIGYDLSGFNLSKRSFLVFTNPSLIRGTISYGMVRLIGFDGKGTLLDPFMKSGGIPLESALFTNGISPHYYEKDNFSFLDFKIFSDLDFDEILDKWDKDHLNKDCNSKSFLYGYDSQLKFLKSTQKNCKVAGVNDMISTSKIDIDWLDTKFSENQLDFVVTYPPFISKRFENEAIVLKQWSALFYQVDFILKPTGKLGLLTRTPDKLKAKAKENKFKVEKEFTIYQGQEDFSYLIFSKE